MPLFYFGKDAVFMLPYSNKEIRDLVDKLGSINAAATHLSTSWSTIKNAANGNRREPPDRAGKVICVCCEQEPAWVPENGFKDGFTRIKVCRECWKNAECGEISEELGYKAAGCFY